MIYYSIACITFLSATLGFVFSVSTVIKRKNADRTDALYLLARSTAIALAAAVPLLRESGELLTAVTGGMLIIQLADGIIGLYSKSRMRTAGPFIMAFLHAISLWTYLSLI